MYRIKIKIIKVVVLMVSVVMKGIVAVVREKQLELLV